LGTILVSRDPEFSLSTNPYDMSKLFIAIYTDTSSIKRLTSNNVVKQFKLVTMVQTGGTN